MGLSEKTARLNMLREVVDFFEYSLPLLIASVTAFVGTLIFLVRLSVSVFVGAITVSVLIVAVYAVTTGRTTALNRGFNDEHERQVDVLGRNDRALTRQHIGLLNSWTVKLSDIDAFSVAFALMLTIGLQVFAIVTTTSQDADLGNVLSIVLYVFELSAVAPLLPPSWHEYLRLRDILRRLRPPRAGDGR